MTTYKRARQMIAVHEEVKKKHWGTWSFKYQTENIIEHCS